MVTFTGYVRDQADGTATESLFLEHYPGMCEREIEAVCDQARQRWPILDTLVVHRVGELHLTEQIVYVGVTSAHRGDAFDAGENTVWFSGTLAKGLMILQSFVRDPRAASSHYQAAINQDATTGGCPEQMRPLLERGRRFIAASQSSYTAFLYASSLAPVGTVPER